MTRVVELASSDWLSGLFVYRRNYYRIKRRLSAVQTVFHIYRIIEDGWVDGKMKSDQKAEVQYYSSGTAALMVERFYDVNVSKATQYEV